MAGRASYDADPQERSSPRSRAASFRSRRSSLADLDYVEYLDDDITSFYPAAFRRETVPDLGEEDVSPKSITTPSLRRPTVPDLGVMPGMEGQEGWNSPGSVGPSSYRRPSATSSRQPSAISYRQPSSGSFRRPSISELNDVPQDDDYPAPHLRYDDYSPMAQPTGDAFPLPRMPNDPSPSLSLPERPPLLTAGSSSAHSSSPLLGDVSGSNTPITPLDRDPFRDAEIHETSESSHPSPASSVSDTGPLPPKIHINCIPNSPVSVDIPSFRLRVSATPRRRSSLAALGHTAASSPTTSVHNRHDSSPGRSLHSTSGLSSGVAGKSTMAQRRAQRMKAGKNGRREKEGRDGKAVGAQMNRKPSESTRLKGEIYKPWLEKKDPAQRWARYITLASIAIGFVVCGIICWNGYASVPNLGKTCLVLNDDFSHGLNLDTWTREVRVNGYDNGEFEWTTNSDNNSFVKDGILYLVPTLTSDVIGDEAITNGYTLNLTADGRCTSTNLTQCVAVSNSSRLTVINPVQSARLTTKSSVQLKYGKVEVVARFPTGDWLWPGIFMLPVNETYGAWPRSGEIDILEARGNNNTYPNRGVDYAQSSLHWGPTVGLDRLYMTWGYREQRRTYYNQKYHTYGLEWNDKYLWTYIDSKVSQVISLRFNKDSFWTRGRFPGTITNTTTGDVIKLTNPWISSENNNAPFDQAFYLIIDLAVGGTDGWFPDGEGGKPWLDDSGTAMYDFWNAKSKWWDTNWPKDPLKRGFAIDSVKIWKTC